MFLIRWLSKAWDLSVYIVVGCPLILLRRRKMISTVQSSKMCDECDYYGIDGPITFCPDHADDFHSVLREALWLMTFEIPESDGPESDPGDENPG